MSSRNTLEFAVGVVVAGVVAGALSVRLRTASALVLGLAAAMPSLARTSTHLDRAAYEAGASSRRQIIDGALAATSTAIAGVASGYAALAVADSAAVTIAAAATAGVFAGQAVFYARTRQYVA
ncbi:MULTISPECIES: hypothetical protein [Halobacterium]|uniref:hypothetical protein n=1 Tax=Halobacterium TaxID=2239 RepID=UPI0019639E99|nr:MULTISPECIES: hypothetical protein [Halobacterium]MCF2164850.1 hypothetical protein [Halobacterium salinarum]MCF2168525.1 hypothetical protein [Halobacterium salinarum]MCF2239296.1 hypothetical protein [Halobacterium salinarum]QRY21983.1 hypothetical protein JT689_08105 [Halobacterium sp. GSL-19]WJK63371.1 hypothetical protein QSJ49_09105 [Halobacterium salinarum]